MSEQDERWAPRDVMMGLAFLVAGAMVVLYAYSAMRKGVPIYFWGIGWIMGPFLLIIGGNAMWKSVRSLKHR